MFSRRHPYLFSLLVFCTIGAAATLGVMMIVAFGLPEDMPDSGEWVGIIEIEGVVAESKEVLQQLKRFRENDAVKAIVLRIDSPGGAVAPSQEIYQEVLKTRETKPIFVSMGTVAASGGYYIAAAAEGIVASPGTITGSIGVIMGFTNLRELLDKIGLAPVVVKSGPYKDLGSPLREMTDAERELLQDFVDGIHRQFVAAVVNGRRMEPAAVEKVADGRIITGEAAQQLGLVDRLGNLADAVEWAGRTAGIQGDIETVYARKKKLPFLETLLEESLQKIIFRVFKPLLIG